MSRETMVEEIRQGDIPGVQLRYRHVMPATPEVTWCWLTDPGRMTSWLAERVETDPTTPETLLLESKESTGKALRERLTSIAEKPEQVWIADLQSADATWPVPTRLEIELTTTSGGTEISILQKGFAHLPLSDCLTIWEHYRRRWRTALTRLEELLAEDSSNR